MIILAFFLLIPGVIVGLILTQGKKSWWRILLWVGLVVLIILATVFIVYTVKLWNEGKFDI